MRERRDDEDEPVSLQRLGVRVLRRCWNKETREIGLVKMRENAVFRVVDALGESYALRIHRAGNHSDAALRSELSWMSALRASDVQVPDIVPTSDGRPFATVPYRGSTRQVDLLRWIDGRPLGTSESGLAVAQADIERTYRTIGELAARLHEHAVTWQLPGDFERHRWDAEGLVGEQPLWGRFWELDALGRHERALLIRARDRVRQELHMLCRDADAQRRFSLIHADFVPENVLLCAAGEVRLIDFDDSGFGWHLFDLATALYFIQDSPGFDRAKASLIEGYRAHRDLPDALLDKMQVFMTARSFTYLGWVHTRPGSREGRSITPRLIDLACRQAEHLLG